MNDVKDMRGKTLTSIETMDDEILFSCDDGTRYKMYHSQDCCESVVIDDVCGDWNGLIGSPLLICEESTSNDAPEGENNYDSDTWTFYRFSTATGDVTLRWHGSSNGYYSESADFKQVTP